MPPISPGHDSEIGTYEGLRHLSQTLVGDSELRQNYRSVMGCDSNRHDHGTGVATSGGGDNAKLGSATLRFGLLRMRGQYLCVQLMGVSDGLFHNKKIIGADEALDLGLVHEVVDDESLGSSHGNGDRDRQWPSGRYSIAETVQTDMTFEQHWMKLPPKPRFLIITARSVPLHFEKSDGRVQRLAGAIADEL